MQLKETKKTESYLFKDFPELFNYSEDEIDDDIFTIGAIKRHIGPICSITGIPLPILSSKPPNNNSPVWYNKHHVFYCAKAEELQDTAGSVVRHSRVQYGPKWAHDMYHYHFENGTILPQTEQQKFTIGVLACSNLIPKKAVDVSGKNPRIVTIGKKSTNEYIKSGLIVPEYDAVNLINYDTTVRTNDDSYAKERGIFFISYLLRNSIDDSDCRREVEDFLCENDRNKKIVRAAKLISHTLHEAIEPVLPIYKQAGISGMLNGYAPKDPKEVISGIIKRDVSDYDKEIEVIAKELIAA